MCIRQQNGPIAPTPSAAQEVNDAKQSTFRRAGHPVHVVFVHVGVGERSHD